MRLEPIFEVPQLILFVILGFLVWGSFLAWRWWKTYRFAEDVFAAKRSYGELYEHVELDTFRKVFVRAEAPLRETYIFAAALVCAIALPPLMVIFGQLWYEIWTLAGRFEPAANGTMVYTFSQFLFANGVMVGVLYTALRHYYSNLPPSLTQAVRLLNGEMG